MLLAYTTKIQMFFQQHKIKKWTNYSNTAYTVILFVTISSNIVACKLNVSSYLDVHRLHGQDAICYLSLCKVE